MIRDIVHKRFRPDESRVERLAAMIDQQDPSSPLVHEESDRDSEDFEAEDLERGDSKASFESRAKEVGIGDALLRDLKAGGVDAYGALAFICGYVPGQGNENVLFDAAKDVIGRDLTNPEKIIVRRLFFESHTMAIADIKRVISP